MKLILSILLILLLRVSFAVEPVLILADKENYGSYTAEILKAEGFNAYKTVPFSNDISSAYLSQFDVVILAEKCLSDTQKDILESYVSKGGNLIAFRPDQKTALLFGIVPLGKKISEGYIRIDTSTVVARGLIPVTLQYHGESDLYSVKEGNKIAEVYSSAEKSTGSPALVINNYGRGHTAAFTYNLPKSIVYSRQGNPAWAGEERDKVDGPTATDLFYPRPGETQWNDPSRMGIPQADEQMHLLSHLIETFSADKKPLPRFWYFPEQLKCMFIFTIDGEDSKESDIEGEIRDVMDKGGNATLYEIGTYIEPSTVERWRSSGNEVAVHYNDVPHYADPTHDNMSEVLERMTAQFRKTYGYLPVTTRNHWVVWVSKDSVGQKEFAQQAVLEAKYGVRFDCNYYQFGGNKIYPNWMGDVGHITGSGLPMKFSDTKGNIINIYQSNTQLPDETWQKEHIEEKSKTLIDRSLDEEAYAWINANFHTWYWPECREPGLRILEYCSKRGVPIWTAERAYEFIRMKDEASFKDISLAKNILQFTVNIPSQNRDNLSIMVPSMLQKKKISRITSGKTLMPFKLSKIKGREYAFVNLKPGEEYSIKVSY